MRSSDLDDHLESLAVATDTWMRAFFERNGPASRRFASMLRYPLGWADEELRPLAESTAGGKRLRPAVCLLSCEAVAGDHRPALAAAAALELVHNFSLVHDDIQDESLLRRGRPSVWAHWGTAQAINVGDSLFALAQLALHDDEDIPSGVRVDASRRLNTTCLRLVEGQFLDLELQSRGAATLGEYQTMIGGKTAALLEGAAWLGARFGGASSERAELFAAFGRELGLAFQLQDDVLGLWGDPVLTGKSADTDLLTRKQALPAVLAFQADGPLAAQFRALFLSEGDMSPSTAARALRCIEALGVREQAEMLVAEGYGRAAQALERAAADGPSGPLAALLGRFRHREA